MTSRAAGSHLRDPEDDFAFHLLRGDVERLQLDIDRLDAAVENVDVSVTSADIASAGGLLAANNLSDLDDVATALSNLGIGFLCFFAGSDVNAALNSTTEATFKPISVMGSDYSASTGRFTPAVAGTYALLLATQVDSDASAAGSGSLRLTVKVGGSTASTVRLFLAHSLGAFFGQSYSLFALGAFDGSSTYAEFTYTGSNGFAGLAARNTYIAGFRVAD